MKATNGEQIVSFPGFPDRSFVDRLLKSNLIPDFLIRIQIRRLLKQRLIQESIRDASHFFNSISNAPIAVDVKAANIQHYELPPNFFSKVLGPHMKYSCALYSSPNTSLAEAENQMLDLTCERAGLADGMDILELGCGWGSMTLWMSERFPNARILGVSNSGSQRDYINAEIKRRNIRNVTIQTDDINTLELAQKFDRIVSIEMFEHMRNIEKLFEKISLWLKVDGKVFAHVFCHRKFSYLFEVEDESDWMSQYFFTGGMMPSFQLYSQFTKNLTIEKSWVVNGENYAFTSRDWLRNMDIRRLEIMPILHQVYGEQAGLWWARWRIFFMACEELWAFRRGTEWHVGHYLFKKVPV